MILEILSSSTVLYFSWWLAFPAHSFPHPVLGYPLAPAAFPHPMDLFIGAITDLYDLSLSPFELIGPRFFWGNYFCSGIRNPGYPPDSQLEVAGIFFGARLCFGGVCFPKFPPSPEVGMLSMEWVFLQPLFPADSARSCLGDPLTRGGERPLCKPWHLQWSCLESSQCCSSLAIHNKKKPHKTTRGFIKKRSHFMEMLVAKCHSEGG